MTLSEQCKNYFKWNTWIQRALQLTYEGVEFPCVWARVGVWQSKATRRDGRNVGLPWQLGQALHASPPMMSTLAAWGSSHKSSQRVESHQGSCWVPVSSGQRSEEATDFWSLNNTKLISTVHSGNYNTHSFTDLLSNSIKSRVLLEKLTVDHILKQWYNLCLYINSIEINPTPCHFFSESVFKINSRGSVMVYCN
jgi:hypothetical protein